MRIIAFVNKNSGPCYHRIIMPLLLMPDVDCFITNNLLEEHFDKGCDVFMYNRVIPDHALPMIENLQKKHGFKICVDVDDYWVLEPSHILYYVYQDEQFAKQQVSHLKKADVVFTTNKTLSEEIQPFNSNVHVIPNAIPKETQFKTNRIPSKLTRLFWQGSITHGEDMAILRRPIECLFPIASKVKMVMGGYMDQNDEWYKMAMDFTANTKHQYKLLPGKHVNEYYSHYKEADICLIPLVNNKFNRCKSNLKVLEAANLALPVICSPVQPYLGLPVYFARGAGEWVTAITRLVNSKKRQREAGEELQEYCDVHFDFNKINKERKQVFENETVNA